MRWILLALLVSTPAWAADDDESPPRPPSPRQQEKRLLRRASGERVAANVLIPSGALLNAGGIAAIALGAILSFSASNYLGDPTPGRSIGGIGVAMFFLGVGAVGYGAGMWTASAHDRQQANPWLASVRF